MSKSLKTLGVLALFAWTAAGFFLWMEVKSKITVTVQESSPNPSGETALIAERVSSLSGDMDALIRSLEKNFELVAQTIGEKANGQAVRSARIEERLANLEQSLPYALQARETAGALSSALSRVESMRQMALAPIPSGAVAVSSAPDVDQAELPALPTQTEEGFTSPQPSQQVSPLPEPEPGSEPVKTSFLAFNLPSRDFQFAGLQTFEVLGDLSRVGFDAKSTLHDFSGVSNLVAGSFQVDLARANAGISGTISIRADSLSTGLEGRDEAMLDHLGSQSSPIIKYEFESFETSSLDRRGQKLAGTVTGKMTINGTTREFKMKITAHVDESRRLVVEGEAALSRADFNVHVPGKLGLISTDDEVRIWIHLRSRSRGEGA